MKASYIRKKGFGPGETQVALGNFVSLRVYFAPWVAPGVFVKCLITLVSLGDLWVSLKVSKVSKVSRHLWVSFKMSKFSRYLWVSLEVSQASLNVTSHHTSVTSVTSVANCHAFVTTVTTRHTFVTYMMSATIGHWSLTS
jgi:hypothetical protein